MQIATVRKYRQRPTFASPQNSALHAVASSLSHEREPSVLYRRRRSPVRRVRWQQSSVVRLFSQLAPPPPIARTAGGDCGECSGLGEGANKRKAGKWTRLSTYDDKRPRSSVRRSYQHSENGRPGRQGQPRSSPLVARTNGRDCGECSGLGEGSGSWRGSEERRNQSTRLYFDYSKRPRSSVRRIPSAGGISLQREQKNTCKPLIVISKTAHRPFVLSLMRPK